MAAVLVGIAAVPGAVAAWGSAPSVQDGFDAAKVNAVNAQESAVAALPRNDKESPEDGLAEAMRREAAMDASEPMTQGIIDTRQGPFPASSFLVRNMYRGQHGGGWIFVFAGGFRDEGGGLVVGGLRVFQQVDNVYSEVGSFKARTGAPPLSVTAVKGDVLSLATDKGDVLTFDLNTLTFGS